MLKPYDGAHYAAEAAAEDLHSPAVTSKQASPPRKPRVKKLFVLDTNVLMHDPTSLFRFEEHDVFLPMVTLEELDSHKKGMSEVARNARSADVREIVERSLAATASNPNAAPASRHP